MTATLRQSDLARERLRRRRRFYGVDAFGYLAVAGVVLTYLLGTSRQFDWANALLFVPVMLPAVIRKAFPSAAITLSFGIFGILHLLGVST